MGCSWMISRSFGEKCMTKVPARGKRNEKSDECVLLTKFQIISVAWVWVVGIPSLHGSSCAKAGQRGKPHQITEYAIVSRSFGIQANRPCCNLLLIVVSLRFRSPVLQLPRV
jgi:hypothetical protein